MLPRTPPRLEAAPHERQRLWLVTMDSAVEPVLQLKLLSKHPLRLLKLKRLKHRPLLHCPSVYFVCSNHLSFCQNMA